MRQFVQYLAAFVSKLYNLRLVDRRKTKLDTKAKPYTAFLIDKSALALDHSPITVRYDSEKGVMEYNLTTRAGITVHPSTYATKITNV